MSCIHCPHCNARYEKLQNELDFLQDVRVKLTYEDPCEHPPDCVTSIPEGQGNSMDVCLCGTVGFNKVIPLSKGPYDLTYIDKRIESVRRRMGN
jgi:hypothetical protein